MKVSLLNKIIKGSRGIVYSKADMESFINNKIIEIKSCEIDNPYVLFYELNDLYDCVKLFKFSFSINHFYLQVNSTHINLAGKTIKFIYQDKIGEDVNDILESDKNPECSVIKLKDGRYNLILNDNKNSIIDSLNKVIELVSNSPEKNLTFGLFFSKVNPSRYFNRGFKFHRLQEIYTVFESIFNKHNNHNNRLLINLSKALLSLTSTLDNLYIQYQSNYTDTVEISHSILNESHLAQDIDLSYRLNKDIIKKKIILTKNVLEKEYKKNKRNSYSVFNVTKYTLLLCKTKLGESYLSAEKLNNLEVKIKVYDKWVYVKAVLNKTSKSVYFLLFKSGNSMELLDGSLIKMQSGEYKLVRDLLEDDVLSNNEIVKSVQFDRKDNYIELYSYSNEEEINLRNNVSLNKSKTFVYDLNKKELEDRLNTNYFDSSTLVLNSIVLPSRVDLAKLNVLDIDQQLNIFKAATLLSCSSLILPEHNNCTKLINTLKYNPVINVCISNIKLFERHFDIACYDKELIFTDTNKHLLNLLINNKIKFKEVDNYTIVCIKKGVKNKLRLVLINMWKDYVYKITEEYCHKHHINVPFKVSSIDEECLDNYYSALQQLELALIYDVYSTQNNIFTINYKEHEVLELTSQLENLIKRKIQLPYLLFKKV